MICAILPNHVLLYLDILFYLFKSAAFLVTRWVFFRFVNSVSQIISLLCFGKCVINHIIHSSLCWFYFFYVVLSLLNVPENHCASAWFFRGEIHLLNSKSFSDLDIFFVFTAFIQFQYIKLWESVKVSYTAFLWKNIGKENLMLTSQEEIIRTLKNAC